MKLQPPAAWKHLIEVGEGDCWLWQGSMGRGVPTLPKGDPVKGSGHRRARHEMLRLCGYEEPVAGTWLSTTCGESRCVNPDHIQVRKRGHVEIEPKPYAPTHWSLADLRAMKAAKEAGYSYRQIGEAISKKKGRRPISRERVRQLLERYDAARLAEGDSGAS